MWNERIEAVLIHGDLNALVVIQSEYQNLVAPGSDQLIDTLKRISSSKDLIFESGIFEKGTNSVIDQFDWSKDHEILQVLGMPYLMIKVKNIPAEPKELDEIKGLVIADYQNSLDLQWIEELTSSYPISVNHSELDRIISRFESR